jgi:hypothetical protein
MAASPREADTAVMKSLRAHDFPKFAKGVAETDCELPKVDTGVVDLTFATASPRVLENANVKSQTTTESSNCSCLFGSDVRKRTRRDGIRMSEPGHQRCHHEGRLSLRGTGFEADAGKRCLGAK